MNIAFDILSSDLLLDMYSTFWTFDDAKRLRFAVILVLRKDATNVRALQWLHITDSVVKYATSVDRMIAVPPITHAHSLDYERMRRFVPVCLLTEDWIYPDRCPWLTSLDKLTFQITWITTQLASHASARQWPNVRGVSVSYTNGLDPFDYRDDFDTSHAFPNAEIVEWQFHPHESTVKGPKSEGDKFRGQYYFAINLDRISFARLTHCTLRHLCIERDVSFQHCPLLHTLLIDQIVWDLEQPPNFNFPPTLTKLTICAQVGEYSWQWIPSSVTELALIDAVLKLSSPDLQHIQTLQLHRKRYFLFHHVNYQDRDVHCVDSQLWYESVMDNMPNIRKLKMYVVGKPYYLTLPRNLTHLQLVSPQPLSDECKTCWQNILPPTATHLDYLAYQDPYHSTRVDFWNVILKNT